MGTELNALGYGCLGRSKSCANGSTTVDNMRGSVYKTRAVRLVEYDLWALVHTRTRVLMAVGSLPLAAHISGLQIC